jgi:hypothetical protein
MGAPWKKGEQIQLTSEQVASFEGLALVMEPESGHWALVLKLEQKKCDGTPVTQEILLPLEVAENMLKVMQRALESLRKQIAQTMTEKLQKEMRAGDN